MILYKVIPFLRAIRPFSALYKCSSTLSKDMSIAFLASREIGPSATPGEITDLEKSHAKIASTVIVCVVKLSSITLL